MRNTMVKLLCLLGAGCFLLGVTLATETNKHQPQQHIIAQQLLRNKRGLLSALFGTGEVQTTPLPAEVLPVYGDPAQPPLHMLYGHSTGLQGPYPPYPVMFVPGGPALGEQGQYLPMLAYGGVPAGSLQPVAGDNNHLPAVIGWPEPTAFAPLAPATEATVASGQQTTTPQTTGAKKPNTPQPSQVDQNAAKSAYLLKLNLSPADERELKRLAKLLGVTDFEHLPPFEDVKALLGTSTSGETIKAIKEYASTPDGLELIKDYVMSYQPAKRISLGKEPYSGNEVTPGTTDAATPTEPAASSLGSGFFAHLRRLKSLLTFGYFDASDETPAETPLETVTPEVPSEAPFTPNEFPGFEIRDGSSRPLPVAHYIIPVRTLPRHASPAEFKYASALPFPYAVHYPPAVPQLQDSNPFTMRKEPDSFQLIGASTVSGPKESPSDVTLPKRIAPPTLATGEVHSFERADLEQPVRTTTPAGQQQELTMSTVTSTIVDHNAVPALADVAELANDTTDFILNVLDTEQTT
ncbi:uncharacterized protein LOC126562041 [Anopheles maculipalpis]|uniref:uncharacterized protein LOC126562041 n=1 Tax=Anopheles maculipalpis TaxID=1496333 RepID=UPI002159AC6B|nr:uncharacterized protein LOC126562041 [Anopheles maculipalpis]